MYMDNTPMSTPAVRVTNGGKNYGKSIVLQGLSMRVERGVTYALLGSSGCGKTTLLSAIVGLKKLSSGSVLIFGEDANKTERTLIGYMPQESGLHAELTISEELHFFGRLYGMDWAIVDERVHFLVELLQLPGVNCSIENLSGGETRRVSLAVALLHKPPLLILDEATVGVDPLLRQSIWEHLYKLVKEESCTIICSTHYTEEARQADVVSVMRNRRLLVEENPHSLLTKFGSDLLEDIVVKLCRSQEMNTFPVTSDPDFWVDNKVKRSNSIVNISYKRRDSQDNYLKLVSLNNGNSVSYEQELQNLGHIIENENRIFRHIKTVYAMFLLNIITMIRHPVICYLLLTLPAFYCLTSYAVYRPEPHPNLGVVNMEQPNCLTLPAEQHKLGCELITFLIKDDKLELEPFSSEMSALTAVHQGANNGYFIIPNNFSRNTAQRLAFGHFTDKETLEGSFIPVHLDITHYIRNLFLLDGLGSGYKRFIEKKLNDSNDVNYNGNEEFDTMRGSNMLLSPFKFNEKLQSSVPVKVHYYEQAAVMSITSVLMIMPAIIGINIVVDKKRGVFQRTLIGGGGLPHLMSAAILMFGLVYLVQMGFVGIVIKMLDIPRKGSVLDTLILCYGQSLIGLLLGISLGIIFNQELEVILMIMGFFVTVFSAQGSITALETLNYWVKFYVIALPSKLPSMALENILFRGWSILHPSMVSCFVVQGSWIVSSVLLTRIAYIWV